ncbi:MAG TPA: hypothetical protein VFV33_08325, partial [Gemmatimonadaceae bacterium]|nr:hypothetical protein [Gemmatimonadaceae bacterium]
MNGSARSFAVGVRATPVRRAALTLAALASWGCSLDVAAPSLVRGDLVDTPANAGILLAGVQADFECALAHYILSAGLFGSELGVGSVFQNMKEIDKRDLSPVNSTYTSLT